MPHRLRLFSLAACGLLAAGLLLLLVVRGRHAGMALRFTLPTGAPTYWTSAAVYDDTGSLVRTLWRHVRKPAGSNLAMWDNRTDDGTRCASGRYTVKVLYHNVDYRVAGVVGNTSAAASDSAHYWHSFASPMAMANAGNPGSPLFVVSGYNEQQSGCKQFDPATQQQATDWLRQDCFTAMSNVATDGTNVYLAARPGMQGASVFVFAVSATQQGKFHTFTRGGSDLRLNGSYEDQHYPSVIDLNTVPSGNNPHFATGLAVQRAGTLLAVAHDTRNTVRLYHKTTGQLLTSIAVPNPRDVAFANNGDLWVITGASVRRYRTTGGTPSLAATISGLSAPVNIATHPTSDLLLVADGGASQQVKAFAAVTGGTATAPAWTLGQPGGWRSTGPAAANDKFGFYRACSGSAITDPVAALVVLADGSFWVGDTECNRLLHFSASRAYLGRIMYRPASYCAAVDSNRPTRMFSDFLEYRLDYRKPLQPGDPEAPTGNGSWRFVKNWAAGQETTHADVIYSTSIAKGLKPVYTLSNGRTYGVVAHSSGMREVVELAASGLRYTGINLTNAAENLYPDGSRRYLSSYEPTGTVTWYQCALTGFDAAGNPQWAAATVLASAPANARTPHTRASYIHQIQCPVTSNHVLIAFDPSKNLADGPSPTWHLGGVKTGARRWLWHGSPAVNSEVPFKGVGNYDTGDGMQYAGAAVGAANDQVVYAFTGEFYNGGQASQWMHFTDDGLFVGQFGVPGYPHQPAKPIGFAGNIYASDIFTTRGEYYVYANDESNVAGVLLWKLDGARDIAKLTGSGGRNGTITLRRAR